jgi:hypothetical protein
VKLKLQPDSIARQPHASFAKKFAPDDQWLVLENLRKLTIGYFVAFYRTFQSLNRRKLLQQGNAFR